MLPSAIELQVVTPQRHVLAESVQSVEMPGKEGYLGVLPGHAPLLTELGVGVLTYVKDGQSRYLMIAHGYAEVLPDRVIVLAEISERAEEVDVNSARESRQNAQSVLAKTPAGEPEWQSMELTLQHSVARLQAAAKIGATSDDSSH